MNHAVQFSINLTKKKITRHRRLMYNFKRADFKAFRELLSKIPWNCCFLTESIEDCWIHFKDVLLLAADQCIPKVTLKLKKRMSWLSDETLLHIKKKRRAYKLAKRTQKSHHFSKYRAISDKVRNMTRRDHLDHLQVITSNLTSNLSTDQRPFWRWMKNIRGHSYHGGATLTNPFQKAETFCRFFVSKLVKEDTSSLKNIKQDLDKTTSEMKT